MEEQKKSRRGRIRGVVLENDRRKRTLPLEVAEFIYTSSFSSYEIEKLLGIPRSIVIEIRRGRKYPEVQKKYGKYVRLTFNIDEEPTSDDSNA